MSNFVLVLDTNRKPLNPCTPGVARGLLKSGKYRHRSRIQIHKGFQTGDIVKAVVSNGKKIGTYVGRVLCRASGSFDIATKSGRVAGISHKYCKSIHKKDGYSYAA